MESLPVVEVAVAVVRHGPAILAGYNALWGAFTLPMTKRRAWVDPRRPPAAGGGPWLEPWEIAAARAACEWLGRTLPAPRHLLEVPHHGQSDRSGEWKDYHLQVFEVLAEERDLALPQAPGPAEWLLPAAWLERQPVSHTALHVIRELLALRLLPSA